jgi:hypothetical protein
VKTTIVICASSKVRDKRDIDRLRTILLPSLLKHAQHKWLDKIILVCPQRVIPELQDEAKHFEIVPDHELLGSTNLLFSEPWVRQQALKLVVANRVDTPTYLLLDCDCFMAQTIRDIERLMPDGKPLLNQGKVGNKEEWWAISSLALMRGDTAPPEPPIMGTTPQFLHKEVVLSLLAELADLYKVSAVEALARTPFTLYQLYWLHLLDKWKPEDLYTMKSELRLSRGVWGNSRRPLTELYGLLQLQDFCFGVLQSTLHTPPPHVLRVLKGTSHDDHRRRNEDPAGGPAGEPDADPGKHRLGEELPPESPS